MTTYKSPPINLAQRVLNNFKSKHTHREVQTNQGGELGRSTQFQVMIDKEDFFLKMTGAEILAQTAIAESPTKYLSNMIRCLLHCDGLGPEYWS